MSKAKDKKPNFEVGQLVELPIPVEWIPEVQVDDKIEVVITYVDRAKGVIGVGLPRDKEDETP